MRSALLASLLALSLAGSGAGASLHISPDGDDAADGSADAPVRTLERLQELLPERPDVTEVVFHDGIYRGSFTVHPPEGVNPADEEALPHLVVRAAEGATPILDGAMPLPADEAEPVEGAPGVFRFDGSLFRSAGDVQNGRMPPIWDEAALTRYDLVADRRAVEGVPGSYTFTRDSLYLRTTDGRHPEEHSIEVGRLDIGNRGMFGMLVWRSNVTVRGLTARNFTNDIHSAGFRDGGPLTKNIVFEGCRAYNCSRGFRFRRTQHGSILRSRAERVGCGVLVNSQHVTIEGNVFLRGPRDGFMIPMPRQEDTGIEIYHPAGEEIVIRDNVAKGFTFCGVFIKSAPGEYHVERNTLVDNAIGVGWSPSRGKRIHVRSNVMLGGGRAMHGQTTDQSRVFHRAYGNVVWPSPWGDADMMRQNLDYMNSVGEDNVMADPRLAAPEADDFRLLPDSPCLDRVEPGIHAGAKGPVPEGFRDEHPPLLDLSIQPALSAAGDRSTPDGAPRFAASLREFPLRVRAHDAAGEVAQMRLRIGDEPWGQPLPYAEDAEVRLPADEGEFAIHVRVADDAGNWSEPEAVLVRAAAAPPRLVGEPTLRANRHGMAVSFRTNVECYAAGDIAAEGNASSPLQAAGTTAPGDTGPARSEHVLGLIRPEDAPRGTWRYRIQLSTRDGDTGQAFEGEFRFEGEPVEYFVSPDGENAEDAGTAERPWRTLQYAVDRALPGDQVTAQPGLYLEGVRITRGGVEGAPLVLAAEKKWEAVLDGQRGIGNLVHLDEAPHVELVGLEVRWYGDPEGAGIRLDNSPNAAVRECKVWNAFWFQGRAVGRGLWVGYSPGFQMERCLVFRQDWAMVLYRSPGSRIEYNTFRGHVHGGLNIVDSVEGTTMRNNCLTYPGNYAYWITVRDPAEMETFDSDYNNLGTRIRHWRDEPGAAPNLPASWGGSKTVTGYLRRGGTFITAREGDPTPDEEGWKGPPNLRYKWLPNATTPEAERGERYLRPPTFEDWQAFSGKDKNSIFADPLHRDLVEFDFRLQPDSPNIGAGEDGTTIGAMPVYEP